MKKMLLGKFSAALIILAASTSFVHLQGQVTITFPNVTGIDLGNPDGIAARDVITLAFTIDGSGQVALDASTASDSADMQDLIDGWDNANAGSTDVASLFGKTFSLLLKSPKRMQCRTGGGIGTQGKNQWRIDDKGKESIWFILQGEVGLEFTSFGYKDLSDSLSNFRLIDYDSDETYPVVRPEVADDTTYTLPADEVKMRYKSDTLTVTASDTATVLGDGGRFFGMTFNIVEPLPKPPAVLTTTPAHADTLVEITSDYMITFDGPMDQATTSAAVTIAPDVTNRVDTWNEAGDELSISFDDLPFHTEFVVTVGAGVKGTNGLNALADTTFTFQTLPAPPTVVYTYPGNNANHVPLTSPLTIEFSNSMIPDSVEKSISFDPAPTILSYAWNDDHSKVVVIVDGMDKNAYVGTVSTVATDVYGQPLPDPFTFSFNTWPVSVEDGKISDVVLYPNPATDIIQIRGMDVASVKIYSLTGKLIREFYNSAVVNVSDIEPGSYVVTISDREDNRVRKLIVIK